MEHRESVSSEQFPHDLNGRYIFEELVGKGAYGEVYAARDTYTNERVAIKSLPLNKKVDLSQLLREIRNHRSLEHHHVVKFKLVIPLPPNIGIVMEYASKGNLVKYIRHRGGLSEKRVRFFFQQLVLAVDYCHKMDVVNRDIKLENVLVTGENDEWPMLKICDFGFSKNRMLDSVETSVVGTIELLPPEVISLEQGETYDGRKADVWCTGLCLYKMVASRYPFTRPNEVLALHQTFPVIMQRIRNLDFVIPEGTPPDCADLIRRILVRDPAQRPSTDEIKQHPYFTTDLPEGAVYMNVNLRRQQSVQTDEEINEIMKLTRNKTH